MPRPEPLVLAAHGTRDPAGQQALADLADAVRATDPGRPVDLGFVDVQTPTLAEVVARQPAPPVIVPLFLAPGHHVSVDLPDAAARHPGARVTPHLGALPGLVDLVAARVAAFDGTGPVVLAAAGSSRPAARAASVDLAARIAARVGREVWPAFCTGPGPRVADRLTGAGGIQPLLLAPGHFLTGLIDLGQAHALRVGAPLLPDPAVVELVLSAASAPAAA